MTEPNGKMRRGHSIRRRGQSRQAEMPRKLSLPEQLCWGRVRGEDEEVGRKRRRLLLCHRSWISAKVKGEPQEALSEGHRMFNSFLVAQIQPGDRKPGQRSAQQF